jgi:acylglycerol lipase
MSYEGEFPASDGLNFYERRWDAEGEAAAHLVLVHGYGEHCSRYAEVGAACNAAGITVHTYDQRGFGHSPGKRAYIGRFDLLLADLDAYLEHIRDRFDGKPWFIMGHSMGGMVLGGYVETRELDARGLVFSSPFLAFPDDTPKLLLTIAGIAGSIVPWMPVGGVDNTGLSRDPAVIEAADNDPLAYHGMVRARTGAQFKYAMERIHASARKIALPAYIIQGGADKVIGPSGAQKFFDGIASEDKQLKLYDEGYHELWNDLCKEEVISGIIEWIEARS